jgi:glycosyltransferase involved in cell wall biosynthesis
VKTILFAHYGENWIRGSERVLLDIVAHLDRDRWRPIVWCNTPAMADAACALDVQVTQFTFPLFFQDGSPPYHPLAYFDQVRQAQEAILRHRVAVIHCNSGAPCQWLVPAGRALRVPVAAHIHCHYLRRSRYTMLVRESTAIVGVASPITEQFVRDGVARSRCKVIHNGVDPARLTGQPAGLRNALGISSGAVLIGTMGSLVRHKGLDLLLQAMRMPGLETVHLAIAGDGGLRQSLEAEVAGDPRVHMLGYRTDVAPVLLDLDILVQASRIEASPLAILEAGFLGVPVIATDVGGVSETVRHGITGLIVPPEDPGAIANALRELVGDSARRRAMGEAARSHIAQHHTVGRMVREFEAEYERLANIPAAELGWFGALPLVDSGLMAAVAAGSACSRFTHWGRNEVAKGGSFD